MLKRLWTALFLILKWLWKWKVVRIFSGIILYVAGLIVMVTIGWWTPGPSGILLLIPGLVILMIEIPFIERLVVAIFAWRFTRCLIVFALSFRFREKPILRRIYRSLRLLVLKKIDFRFSFKKHGWRKK